VAAAQRVNTLAAKLALASQAAADALAEVAALECADLGGDSPHWLPGLREALERIQLDCADARFAVRELRAALPPAGAIQPLLL
jgi:hypothetical protein